MRSRAPSCAPRRGRRPERRHPGPACEQAHPHGISTRYRPGDRLPSSRALAIEWGVSRTTVTAAYAQLIAEGYLLNRPGARAVVARGLAAAPVPEVAAPKGVRALSDFAEHLLSLPAPARFQTYRVADLRYGDLSGADFPMLAWRRALNRA